MFFKSFVSRNQSKNGDNIWISVCGNLSVIIDAVSISRNPELTNKFIIEFLNELENDLMQHTSEEIIIKLNDTLVHKNNDLLASVCVLKKINNTIHYSSVGNTQIIKLTKQSMSLLIDFMNQPESVFGVTRYYN